MSNVALEFMGGPYDGEVRAVNEQALHVTAPEPDRKAYCKYARYRDLMVYLGSGTKEELSELRLGTSN